MDPVGQCWEATRLPLSSCNPLRPSAFLLEHPQHPVLVVYRCELCGLGIKGAEYCEAEEASLTPVSWPSAPSHPDVDTTEVQGGDTGPKAAAPSPC